ncbi:hypothetical protein PAXINDRAFT_20447 [Paxillus involutus ATCC 200175]|uniref:C2 domain-containing protein n=1 Tax=Paxillus involutus ATCC 200175 TaxID=664439 RepID=A0A0C9SML0_PAXIN|nr:hypothetical protein PAXINDRAFT_20447 [Paxillus involutus ATCC 200175]
MPQISTLTETVSLISQCPDLTQDRWMQCTSDNVTPQPLADVASDPTVEPEEGVNEDQPGVKLTGFRVFIEDIHLHDPPKIGWSPLGGSFYVKISLDGQVQKTSLTGTCRMPWTKKLIFNGAHDAVILTLTVFAHRILHKDVHLGTIEGKLGLFMGRPSAVHALLDSHRDHSGNTRISFSIGPLYVTEPVSISEVTSDPTINKILSDAECFAPFLEKIKVFASLAEGFAEIHPYAKAAWFILSRVVSLLHDL